MQPFDWCMDDYISDEEEQKHESGDDIAIPAIVKSYQLSSSSDEKDSSIVMKKLMHVPKILTSWL